jgi:hypothetical protein
MVQCIPYRESSALFVFHQALPLSLDEISSPLQLKSNSSGRCEYLFEWTAIICKKNDT